ncbi:MAG: DUF4249 domain-containing protein [Cyclobacteriaceae bacterium]|nr:DUF4249 domain-containing protein [Cyclobacteriaceae bacterium]
MILLVGCIDPYSPPVIEQGSAALVIDGFINVSGESTIQLSRTQNLIDAEVPQVETGATLWLEDETGIKIYLFETEHGKYFLPAQNFASHTYRLNIQTQNLREYRSSFESVKISPAIDSVTWNLTDNNSVQIKVNTHDVGNEEGFYRWTFDETWLYTSADESIYVYDYPSRSVQLRTDNIYQCYRTDKSSDLLIESTIRLSKNIVRDYPLKRISPNSERLRYKYSILTRQYAITQDAFNYWQQLKKTTEDLGTLFGPIPGQVTGNFQSLNDSNEPVIGYFAIGSVTTKRIFISFLELPTPTFYDIPYRDCEIYSLFNPDVQNFSGPYLLTHGIPNPNGPGIIGYYYGIASCIDCRLSGGVNTKPDFWE